MAMVRHAVGEGLTPERRAAMKAEIEAAGIIDPEKKPVTAVSETTSTA